MKNARIRGRFLLLAEWTGLACVSQAAAAPGGAALLVPPGAAQAAPSTPHNEKRPHSRAFLATGGVDGTRLRFAGRCRAGRRGPSRPAGSRAGGSLHSAQMKNARIRGRFLLLAEWTGLEPATPGVTGRYSNRLNYHSCVGPCVDENATCVDGEQWWVLRGSNPRPTPCKGAALPAELSTRSTIADVIVIVDNIHSVISLRTARQVLLDCRCLRCEAAIVIQVSALCQAPDAIKNAMGASPWRLIATVG